MSAAGINERRVEILLVEDNPGDVRLLRFAFEQISTACNIRVARDGAEALELVKKSRNNRLPDLILLDLNLPKVSGHEVLTRIKSDPATGAIPVIILSTSDSPDDIRQAYRQHANSYLTKPRDLDQLIHLVEVMDSFWLRTATLPFVGRPDYSSPS